MLVSGAVLDLIRNVRGGFPPISDPTMTMFFLNCLIDVCWTITSAVGSGILICHVVFA